MSNDPVGTDANTGGNFNRYWYADNNPFRFTDPDGRNVVSLESDNNGPILAAINEYSATQYKFDDQNNLVADESKATNEKGSSYYSDRLDAAISSKLNVVIGIADRYGPADDSQEPIDIHEAGGGVIDGQPGESQLILITNRPYTGGRVTKQNGLQLEYNPSDVLMHELLGHGIPRMLGTDTGNAIKNENKARIQIPGKSLRAADPGHGENRQR